MMLRFSKNDLCRFILSFNPCFEGLKDFLIDPDKYMRALEAMKECGEDWATVEVSQTTLTNIKWLYWQVERIDHQKEHLHVVNFNDAFWGELLKCGPLSFVHRLEIYLARYLRVFYEEGWWSPEERAALKAPRNIFSKSRVWLGQVFVGKYGVWEARYLKFGEEGGYSAQRLREMSVRQLNGICFTVQPLKEGRE